MFLTTLQRTRLRRFSQVVLAGLVCLPTVTRASDLSRQEPELAGRTRVSSGEVLPPFHLTLALGLDGLVQQGYVFPGDRYGYLGSRLALLYGLFPNAQLRLDVKYARGRSDQASPEVLQAFGDSELSFRYVASLADSLTLGGELIGSLFAKVPGQSGFFEGGRLEPRQLARYTVGRFRLDQHLGFVWDRSAHVFRGGPTALEAATYDLSAYNRMTLGLRPAVVVDRFLPYAEALFDFPLASPLAPGRGSKELGLGVGIALPANLLVDAAARFGADRPRVAGYPALPPWRLLLAVAYEIDGRETFEKVQGWIRTYPSTVNLAVYDAAREQLLKEATIVMVTPDGIARGKGTATWLGNGDSVTYTVSAPYYAPATGEIALVEGQVHAERVLLRATHGWVRGMVSTPAGDGKAILTLQGPSASTQTVAGAFRVPLLPGDYAGTLTAPGAATLPVSFAVAVDAPLNLGELKLRPPQRHVDVADDMFAAPAPESSLAPVADKDVVVFFSDALAVSTFHVGSTELSEADRNAVLELARRVKSDPTIAMLIVQGGADDTGSPTTNVNISRQRAYAVSKELHRQGVPEEMIAIKVQYFLRGMNRATPEQRAEQRQVTVQIVYK